MTFVLALSIALAARAETPDILGAGTHSCGRWLSERQAATATQKPSVELWGDSQWVLGYITGVNLGMAQDLNLAAGTTGMVLLDWIDNYCKGHPLENLGEASTALFRELTRRKTGR